MLRILLAPAILFALLQSVTLADTNAAKAIANSWLSLVDGGDAAAAYNQSAALHKQQLSADQFTAFVESIRSPLGGVKSRKSTKAEATQNISDLPNGDYVVITYKTSFAKKDGATEKVTVAKDSDGKWRVASYILF